MRHDNDPWMFMCSTGGRQKVLSIGLITPLEDLITLMLDSYPINHVVGKYDGSW